MAEAGDATRNIQSLAGEPSPISCVAIAGGGSGGHIMPGLAVARALQRSGVEKIVFIGTARGLETKLVTAAGYPLELISIGGLMSGSLVRRAQTLVDLPRSILQSRRILKRWRAEVVFGIGGYASGPGLAAAALRRTPAVVLEINARSGLANRLASPWVAMAAVNFPETARDYKHAIVTGIPIREEFFRLPPRTPSKTLRILAFGGSQGAKPVNLAMVGAARLAKAWDKPWTLVHQTGPVQFEEIAAAYRQAGLDDRVEAAPFIREMDAAMAAADVVVCRSGASTLGELAAAGRAAILIPLASAANQHQLCNAQAYAAGGAAVVLEQAALTPESLADQLRTLLNAPVRRAEIESAVRKFGRPDAAETIAGLVTAAARHSQKHKAG